MEFEFRGEQIGLSLGMYSASVESGTVTVVEKPTLFGRVRLQRETWEDDHWEGPDPFCSRPEIVSAGRTALPCDIVLVSENDWVNQLRWFDVEGTEESLLKEHLQDERTQAAARYFPQPAHQTDWLTIWVRCSDSKLDYLRSWLVDAGKRNAVVPYARFRLVTSEFGYKREAKLPRWKQFLRGKGAVLCESAVFHLLPKPRATVR